MNVEKKRYSLISEESLKYLHYRIQEEEMSSRIYLSMSLWLEYTGFKNAAKLWRKYADEEMVHASWAREYLLAIDVMPIVPMLQDVRIKYEGLPDIIKKSYEHEIVITNQLKELAEHALKEKDHMLYTLASKYLVEQIEEHEKTTRWMDELKTFGSDKHSLRLLDNIMGNE